nr:electron transport complex subunit E [bacterium]
MNKAGKILYNGLVTENPTFRLVLGMCPTLAVTTAAINGLGMGISVLFVLTCSNYIVSLLRNFIPDNVRIPAYIVVIASFSTIVQMLLQAFVPSLYASLGIYLPLIVVNCIILGRAEAFASKHTPGEAFLDGIGMGLGFTVALVLVASVREILGQGTLFGIQVGLSQPALLMSMAPGGFITLGLVMALVNKLIVRGGDKA